MALSSNTACSACAKWRLYIGIFLATCFPPRVRGSIGEARGPSGARTLLGGRRTGAPNLSCAKKERRIKRAA